MSGRTARISARCGSCGIPIDRKTAMKIMLESERGHRLAFRAENKAHEREIVELKQAHKRALARIAAANKVGISRIQKIAQDKSRQDRILFDQEFSRLKSSYQANLAQLKDSQTRQNVIAINALKESMANAIEENRKQFGQLVQDNQSQMSAFQEWLQNELPRHILEGVSANVSTESPDTESDTDKLVRELDSRDQIIEKAKERIARLEGELSSRQGKTIWNRMRRASPPEPYKEEESADPQQEVLNMIREIAQERSQMKELQKAPEQRNLPAFTDSFGSRMAKKVMQ